MTERVSILCSDKPEIIPEGALEACCATCGKEIIYDPIGMDKVKAAHPDSTPTFHCFECIAIIMREEEINYRGWAKDLP